MTCDQCQPLLIDALLGELPSEQQAAVDAHQASCDACQIEFNRLQTDFSLLAEAVEPVAPPEEVRSRLLSSLPTVPMAAATDETVQCESKPATVAFSMSEALDQPASANSREAQTGPWTSGMLWAATLLGIAVGGLMMSALQSRSRQQGAEQAAVEQREQAAEELASVMRSAQRLADKAGLRRASFESEERPELMAMLTWDAPSGQLHFHSVGLPQPPTNQVYRLWLIDAEDQWTLAGSLAEAPGAYQLLTSVPPGTSAVSAALTLSVDSEEGRGHEIARTEFAGD